MPASDPLSHAPRSATSTSRNPAASSRPTLRPPNAPLKRQFPAPGHLHRCREPPKIRNGSFDDRRSRSSPSALQSRLRDQRSRVHGESRPTSLSSSSHTSYMPGAPASCWPTRPDPPRGANPCPTRRRCGDAARRAQRRRARARPTRCSRANLRSTRRGLVSLRHAPLGGVPGRLIPRRLYREPPPNHDRTSGRDALSR